MGKKKKLRKIVDAVSGIIGNDATKRKLKKVEAISRFLEEMKTRLTEIQSELDEGGLAEERASLLTRHVAVLHKQIAKTEKIIATLTE